MRIVKHFKQKITFQELGEVLNVDILNVVNEDNYLKVTTKKNSESIGASIYLRCADIKELFNLENNIFDTKDLKVNKDSIFIHTEEEVFKGSASKWQSKFRKNMRVLFR